MSTSIVIAAPEAGTSKSAVTLGILSLLSGSAGKVDFFRPLVHDRNHDPLTEALAEAAAINATTSERTGATFAEVHADPEAALSQIIATARKIEAQADVVIVDGSALEDTPGGAEFAFNGKIAANLGAQVVIVLSALELDAAEVALSASLAKKQIEEALGTVAAFVASRCPEEKRADVLAEVGKLGHPVFVLPEEPLLHAPTFGELTKAVGGELILGDRSQFDREVEGILICGMKVEHVLERLRDGQVVIVAGDRTSLLMSLFAAQASQAAPSLTGIILIGYLPDENVMRLLQGLNQPLPVVFTEDHTYSVAQAVDRCDGPVAIGSRRKIDLAINMIEREIGRSALQHLLELPEPTVTTPLMFEADLIDRARADRRTIVLPEAEDPRILRATQTLLTRGVADLILLGEPDEVRSRAAQLGLNIADARILSPSDPDYLERYSETYAQVRAHKGVTLDAARDLVRDVSFFGTMMVHLGEADGMVSGATHTTAHTLLPAFRVIKTRPGTSIVSSVFLMLMPDRVLVYGDCAVNPDPTADQLADIAVSSALTAQQFGVEPRVAMISYSTGDSGYGSDVDKVREATRLAKERAPQLTIAGPIQYDASVDAAVAAQKMPGSEVAGRASVFIFPDLNTGNTTYKAVQRSSGAVAVGPILQGLNRPVNDLSRGATVADIVNTVAITAIQAQDA